MENPCAKTSDTLGLNRNVRQGIVSIYGMTVTNAGKKSKNARPRVSTAPARCLARCLMLTVCLCHTFYVLCLVRHAVVPLTGAPTKISHAPHVVVSLKLFLNAYGSDEADKAGVD